MSKEGSIDTPIEKPVLDNPNTGTKPILILDRKNAVSILEKHELQDILPKMYNSSPKLLNDGDFNELCTLFEIVSNQFNILQDITSSSNTNIELEARIGNFININEKSIFNPEIKFNEFNNIISYLMNFVNTDSESSFDLKESITLEVGMSEKNLESGREIDSEIGKYSIDLGNTNTRFTIEGLNNIQQFCKINSENIKSNSPKIHDLYNKLINIKNIGLQRKRGFGGSFPFLRREGVPNANTLLSWKYNYLDYDFRISSNLETEIDINDVENSREFLINVLTTDNEKSYRLKKRYSFIPKNKAPCRIDLTIVKSSKGKNVANSRVFNSNEEYHAEVEYIPNISISNINSSFESFIKLFTFLVKLKNKNKYIVSYPIKYRQIMNYNNLVFKQSKVPPQTKQFVGADVMSLKVNNLYETSQNNILTDYAVTDKADGERMLLYIPEDNHYILNKSTKIPDEHIEVYLINNRMDVQRVGFFVNKSAKVVGEGSDKGTLIDGEFIAERELFLAFDLLFYKGDDYRVSGKAKNLHERIDKLNEIQNRLQKDKYISRLPNSKFTFKTKKFKFIEGKNKEQLLFDSSQSIWDDKSNIKIYSEWTKGSSLPKTPYHLDGMIYTPINIPYPKSGGRWEQLFKWKPPMLNTIDFLVRTIKEGDKDKVSFYSGDEINTEYKSLNLYVGKVFKSKGKSSEAKYSPSPFVVSIDGENPEAQIANVRLDERKRMMAKDPLSNEENEILDNTIVEFAYHQDNNALFRWVPIRIRYDKTELYRKTKSVAYAANNINTALNVWDSMMNPISEAVITR